MLNPSVNSKKKLDKRTKQGKRVTAETKDLPMSLAHLNDSIGYENPHILTHAKTIMKSTDLNHAKRNAQHVIGHAQALAEHNKKLHRKLAQIPSVKKELNRLSKNGSK